MTKKSIKEAAIQGVSVFDTIAKGPEYVENVQNVQDVINVQSVQRVRGRLQLERLNLKIPTDIKAYLQAAAYRESSPTHTVSLTEYLCDLVRADMEKYANK